MNDPFKRDSCGTPVVGQPSFNSSPVACSVGATIKTTPTRANTHAAQKKKKKSSPLLRFGRRAKFETKSAALRWVIKLWPRHASICGKHGDRFFHTAQPSLYLQMVLLGRNVTFDSVSLTERASPPPMKCARGGFFLAVHAGQMST